MPRPAYYGPVAVQTYADVSSLALRLKIRRRLNGPATDLG